MAEEVLLETGLIKITPARVVIGGTTYAVANITSVKAVTDSKARYVGVLVAIGGVLIILTLKPVMIAVGAIAVVVGALLAVFGVHTEVVLTTGASEQAALRSRDAKVALQVASAINLAIMKRSAILDR